MRLPFFFLPSLSLLPGADGGWGGKTRPIKMVLHDPVTNDVLATTTALLELDARGQLRAKDAESGVTGKRRVRVRGEVEL